MALTRPGGRRARHEHLGGIEDDVLEEPHGREFAEREALGCGRPVNRSTTSEGMSTPAAIVSGSAPGKRGFTSSSAGPPLAVATQLHVGDADEPDGAGDGRGRLLQLGVVHGAAGDRSPESTRVARARHWRRRRARRHPR